MTQQFDFQDQAFQKKLKAYTLKNQNKWGLTPADPDNLPPQAMKLALEDLLKKYMLDTHPVPADVDLLDKALDHASAAFDDKSVLTGRVAMDYGAPGAGLKVRLRMHSFGAASEWIGAELQTDDGGFFTFTVAPKPGATYEIVAIDKEGKDAVLGTPFTHLQDKPTEIALIAPADLIAHASELERLEASIQSVRGAGVDIGLAREDDGENSDLALLATDTGWDIRLMALAAGAKKNSKASGLSFKASYALSRMGLRSDAGGLALISAKTLHEAFEEAGASGIVKFNAQEIAAALQLHDEIARDKLGQLKLNDAGVSVDDFITMGTTDAADAKHFREALFEHATQTTNKTLWDLAADKGVDPASLKRLRWQEPLARFTGANAALMALMTKTLDTDKELSQLVTEKKLTTAKAWKSLLSELTDGSLIKLELLVPKAEGASLNQRVDAYSEGLASQVRRAFPTEALLQRVEGMTPALLDITQAERDAMVTALTRDGGVRIGSQGITPIAKTLAAKPRAMVERLHRLYQVTPDDATFDLVWQEPAFRSAYDIASVPRAEWLDRFKRKYPNDYETLEDRLKAMHAKSVQVSEVTQNLYGLVPSVTATPETRVLRAGEVLSPADAAKRKQQFPMLSAMVGELPACEHCRSVLSPSAYFVDMLRLLDRSDADWVTFTSDFKARHGVAYPYGKPFEVLDRRRPDLADLALTCANTHTALPYIDIVNELLEGLVMVSAPVSAGIGEDETWSTDELVAEPRRSRPEAYEKLAESCHPAALPLDLPWEQARAMAPLLGLQPGELIEALQPDAVQLAAAERLALSPAEAKLFVDPAQLGAWFKWYGMDSADAAPPDNAAMLADRLGLTPEQLVEVFRTQFANPQLQALVLLQKLGLSPSEVVRYKTEDPALKFSAAENIEFGLRLTRLNERFGNGFDGRAAINTLWDSGKLKKALVLAETVPRGGFDTLKVRCGDGSKLSPHAWLRLVQFVRLMRRLGWSAEQTDRCLGALHPGGPALDDQAKWAPRMQAMLVQLDRMQQLKALLKSSDDEFFLPAMWSDLPTSGIAPLYGQIFLRETGRSPFDDPQGAYLSSAGLKLHEQIAATAANLGLDEAAIRLLFPDKSVRLTLAVVSALYRHARFAKALGLSVAELVEWKELLAIDPCKQPTAALDSVLEASARTLRFARAVQAFRARQVTAARLKSWLTRSFEPAPQARPRKILQMLQAEFADKKNPLPESVKDTDYPSSAMAARIVSMLGASAGLAWQPLAKELVAQIFEDLSATSIDLERKEPFSSEAGLRRLAIAIDVANALRIGPDVVCAILSTRGVFGDRPDSEILPQSADVSEQPEAWLDLLELTAESQPSAPQASKWPALVDAARVADGQAAKKALTGVVPCVAAVVGCSNDDVEAAVELVWKDATEAALVRHLTTWRGLHKLVTWLRLAARMGLSPNALAKWKTLTDVTDSFTNRLAVASSVRDAARARYTARNWLTAVRPGADRLRQRRRDALLAFVIARDKLGGDDKVYERYLIDTRMEPAVLTSRLRMAISSVQLFVQRCLLSLESDEVLPTAIRGNEWEWMRRYRVWEANRKIFLYPENWLDPEFRDDRSPLFRRLERRLLQTEINNDEAEDALFEYTRDLETIAKLDIVASTCEQPPGDAAGNTVHVIGRTHSAPHRYFHRRNSHGWTPWEPIDADIQGEHVLAAFWKQKLHVFWLNFSDSAAQKPLSGPLSAEKALLLTTTERTREVRLAWADCVRGEWHTHLAAGSPMLFTLIPPVDGKGLPPERHIFARISIERDDKGEDIALRVHVHADNQIHKAFVVIGHNAPVVVEDNSKELTVDDMATSLQGLVPEVNRFRLYGGQLVTSFYSIKNQVVNETANGRTVENPEADAGPGRLLKLKSESTRFTLLDAPLRIAELKWAQRLSPFFYSDESGSYYVEATRKTSVETRSEEWWDVDWKKIIQDNWIQPVKPIFPGLGPRPGPIGDPPRLPDIRDPRTPKDWLLDPGTVVRYGEVLIGPTDIRSMQR